MKKFLAREFLWLVLATVLAVPLGFLFLHFLDLATDPQEYSEQEEFFFIQLYIIGVILSFIGIYLARLVVVAYRIITAK
jgi:hypothetical protein